MRISQLRSAALKVFHDSAQGREPASAPWVNAAAHSSIP